jgi:uncharacterized protein (DUF302 family)
VTPDKRSGLVNLPSNHSVDETVEKVKGILQAKGIALFAVVDHSGEAEKAGTPSMLAAPSSAIDLPLKILIIP